MKGLRSPAENLSPQIQAAPEHIRRALHNLIDDCFPCSCGATGPHDPLAGSAISQSWLCAACGKYTQFETALRAVVQHHLPRLGPQSVALKPAIRQARDLWLRVHS